jgi:CPA1 family monovalent cation:H+ antiporter
MHLEVILSLFTLMLISIGVFFLSQRMKIPYTVLLVVVGSLLVPLSHIEIFSFIDSFQLTPELLFFVFLPILIFESAYNMNIRKMAESAWSISLLAVVSLILSAFFVALGMFYGLKLIGFDIPFVVALLFGALISATDPVAVLALFKEYGAPRRLALIFEGESLFNDGTSLALFLIILEVLVHGFGGAISVMEGVFMFTTMIVGGIGLGLVMGAIFAKLIERVKDNENIEITLTMLVAHFTFILAEILSEHLVIFGYEIKFSSIIATVVASMLIGNYGRYKISSRVEEYMEKFWGYFAFIANSLVFILMGLLFANLNIDFGFFIVPILTVVAIVALGRAFSVYPVVAFLNRIKKEENIPLSWQHLMAWGSLRGALAVTMVLLIPDTLTVSGWQYEFTLKEFITAVTIGCIYFTLLVKATTIGPMMRRLQLDALTPYEKVEYHESKALIYAKALLKLSDFRKKGYVGENTYTRLKARYERVYQEACHSCKQMADESSSVVERALQVYALGVEKHYLKELFLYGEISERVYKRVLNKLEIQTARVEHGIKQVNSLGESFSKDWFENLADMVRKFLKKQEDDVVTRYMYYRAQSIIANKVLKNLDALSQETDIEIFKNTVEMEKLKELYTRFRENAGRKMNAMFEENTVLLERVNEEFAAKGLFKIEETVLKDLYKKEMITPKLYIMLYNELEKEVHG